MTSIIREPYYFNKNLIFITKYSFKQNKYIAKDLNRYVELLLNSIKKIYYLVCIGGESYLYGICNQNINIIFHYTNSNFIYEDLYYNNKFYKKNIENNLIDYNKFNKIKNGTVLILNLAKLNLHLLNTINTRFYKFIIIINCHHDEFWKRIKLLRNYKLITRKQFVTSYNFITVNLLKYKKQIPQFISLGLTCTVAFQLNNLGIRTKSYPFDWTKLSINKINKVLNNHFDNYSNIKIKKYSNNHNSYLLTNNYNITFAHELYEDNDNNINILKNKLINRIKRFNNLKNKNVIFVLLKLDYKINNLLELINNLKKYIQNFKIIYITINKTNNFNHPNIKFINIDNNTIHWDDWKHNKFDWFNILFN